MASHTVYAVASGKGGVGKTATTVNLGASLAAAGYKVAVVDTDLGMANLGGFVGLGEDGATLHEVLAGEVALEEAVYEAFNGLAVVPSGISLNGFANVETEAMADAVNALRNAFDYVILDLGAGLSHDTVLPLALADAVVLVSTPHPLSIQDTAKTREVTEHLGGQVAGVVLTRADPPAELDLDGIREELGLPVLAVIPESDAVPASARTGESLLEHAPDSPATEGYRGLATIVEEESLESAPVVPEIPQPETTPTDQHPPDQQPPSQQPPDQQPTSQHPPDQQPTSQQPPDQQPTSQHPPDQGQAGQQPSAQQPPGQQPSGAGAPAGSSPPAEGTASESPPADPPAGQPTDQEPVGAGGQTAPGAADPGPTDPGVADPDPSDQIPESGAADPGSGTPDPDPGSGTADQPLSEDSTERTAAEIAAAIEEAAADESTPTPASGTFDEDDAEPEAGVEPGAESGTSPADAGGPAAETEIPEEPETGSEDPDEPEAFQVEADAPGTTEQEEAVDELFSVEGDDSGTEEDDEGEDEDDSKGLLGRFLG